MGDNEDDIFNDIINIEQKFYEEGLLEGEKHGIEQSSIEGKLMGHKQGIHLGSEFGFYKSCIDTWIIITEKYPHLLKSSRTSKLLIKFRKTIESTSELSFKEIIDKLPFIRNKFKQLSLQIGFNNTLFITKSDDEKLEF